MCLASDVLESLCGNSPLITESNYAVAASWAADTDDHVLRLQLEYCNSVFAMWQGFARLEHLSRTAFREGAGLHARKINTDQVNQLIAARARHSGFMKIH